MAPMRSAHDERDLKNAERLEVENEGDLELVK